MSCIVGILGAESTGKTTLARDLAATLRAEGRSVALVSEYLREFCDAHQRTPRPDEQRGIAQVQTGRMQSAASAHEIVIADTTALMTAVYSELVFGDRTLYDEAIDAHRHCTVTLLTALDLPWQADGLQRDGPQVREPVTRLVREALQRGGLPYAVIGGSGPARLASALAAVRHALQVPLTAEQEAALPRWAWLCERCSDADCERHLRLPR